MAYFQKKHRTFTDEIQNKMNEKRLFNQNMIDNTILGQLESTKLIYKDYNLDMDYIMRQRINEYQQARQQHYRQFVQGMIPTNIIKDLQELEEKQKQDKAAGLQQKEEQKSFVDQKAQQILDSQKQSLEETIKNSLISTAGARDATVEQNADLDMQNDEDTFVQELFDYTEAKIQDLNKKTDLSPQELLKLKRLKQEQQFTKLNNNAINTMLYLKMQNPDEFKEIQQQRYAQMSKNVQDNIMAQYFTYVEQKKGNAV